MDESALDLDLTPARTAHGVAGLRLPTGESFAIWDVLKALGGLMANFPADDEPSAQRHRFRDGARALERSRETPRAYEDFLHNLEAKLTFDLNPAPACPRTLELLNKTSRFNLNGRQTTHEEWHEKNSRPGAFLSTINYQDRFCSLGKVSAIQGYCNDTMLHVERWAIRDRALNRRIEHQIVAKLFDTFSAAYINFHFTATPTNKPVREFFAAILGAYSETSVVLSKERWAAARP